MKNRSSSQDRKDMYTKERKSKMTEQVAELHQHSSRKESHRSQEISHTMSQQESTTSHTAHSHESMSNVQTSTSTTSSSTQKVVTGQVTTQQVTSSQTNQSQEMAEWQKIATKEKKHVDYAQSSHFSKVI